MVDSEKRKEQEEKYLYFVTMIDTFLSGWGKAEGKRNKLIFLCSSLEEAEIVATNAEHRSDMKYINIHSRPPYYNKKSHYVQFKTKEDYPKWYKAGAF